MLHRSQIGNIAPNDLHIVEEGLELHSYVMANGAPERFKGGSLVTEVTGHILQKTVLLAPKTPGYTSSVTGTVTAFTAGPDTYAVFEALQPSVTDHFYGPLLQVVVDASTTSTANSTIAEVATVRSITAPIDLLRATEALNSQAYALRRHPSDAHTNHHRAVDELIIERYRGMFLARTIDVARYPNGEENQLVYPSHPLTEAHLATFAHPALMPVLETVVPLDPCLGLRPGELATIQTFFAL